MPTPSSGAIRFSDIAWIVSNSYTARIALGDNDPRRLITNSLSVPVSMSDAYSKPTSGNTDAGGYGFRNPGSYTFYIPPYQNMYAQVAGGGGGGSSGNYGGTEGCGPYWAWRCCSGGTYCYSVAGGSGGGSSFNDLSAGGGSSSSYGTNNQNGNQGGGGAGGAGGSGAGECNNAGGPAGYSGGICEKSYTRGVNGPGGYGAAYSVAVGGGGAGGSGCAGPGGNGGNGWVYISWS